MFQHSTWVQLRLPFPATAQALTLLLLQLAHALPKAVTLRDHDVEQAGGAAGVVGIWGGRALHEALGIMSK